jgi:hypothetical protein
MSVFRYSVTRPIGVPSWGHWLFWIVATTFVVVITLLNIISVGYEYIQVQSPVYNTTQRLWYEKLPFAGWSPPTFLCTPAELVLDEGISLESKLSYC